MSESIHMPEGFDVNKGTDTPITVNGLLKMAGITFALISALISVIWFFASLKSDMSIIREEAKARQVQQEGHDKATDKDIEQLKTNVNEHSKTIDALDRKLDVAVSILERIDKKVGQP